MGLFDEIVCEYPLPDGWAPPTGTVFQTKDTEDQFLIRFTLCADGTLRRSNGDRVDHHGALEFYTSNWAGFAPWGAMTSDDEPLWSAEYVALYDHGKLLKIEGSREPDTSERWMPREEWMRRSREVEAQRAALSSGAGDANAATGGGGGA